MDDRTLLLPEDGSMMTFENWKEICWQERKPLNNEYLKAVRRTREVLFANVIEDGELVHKVSRNTEQGV